MDKIWIFNPYQLELSVRLPYAVGSNSQDAYRKLLRQLGSCEWPVTSVYVHSVETKMDPPRFFCVFYTEKKDAQMAHPLEPSTKLAKDLVKEVFRRWSWGDGLSPEQRWDVEACWIRHVEFLTPQKKSGALSLVDAHISRVERAVWAAGCKEAGQLAYDLDTGEAMFRVFFRPGLGTLANPYFTETQIKHLSAFAKWKEAELRAEQAARPCDMEIDLDAEPDWGDSGILAFFELPTA